MQRQTRCEACPVRHRSVCGALSSEEIAGLHAIARQRTVAAGQTIMRAGEPMDYFANIVSGVVKLGRTEADGQQITVGLQFASDFLGRPFRTESVFDAIALTEVRLCQFPSRQFEDLMRVHRGVEHRLFQRTLDELDAAREWMAILGRRSALQRVAALLTSMAERSVAAGCAADGSPDTTAFEIPLSRQDMADFLGLTIETVSRQFTQLKRDGVIALPGHRDVVVLDQDELRRHAA